MKRYGIYKIFANDFTSLRLGGGGGGENCKFGISVVADPDVAFMIASEKRERITRR
jgi:hypothetical protein